MFLNTLKKNKLKNLFRKIILVPISFVAFFCTDEENKIYFRLHLQKLLQ